MKVYYAHAICLFKSEQEQAELASIRAEFKDAEIINPDDQKYMWQKAKDHMGFLMTLVDQSDVLVYSRLLGEITQGVGLEINHALENGKAVFELNNGVFISVTSHVTMISREATRLLFHKFWGR